VQRPDENGNVRIVVSGLWHLGCVTAACAAEHFDVVGHDPDPATIAQLANGMPPIAEPGLTQLIETGLRTGRLRFSADAAVATDADVIWITYDTAVDERDHADVEPVFHRITELLTYVKPGTLIVVSSQVPVGFTERLERYARETGADVAFAYLPENLRLGQALEVFREPDRIVAGVRTEAGKTRITALVRPFTGNVLWMTPESAEMTKHALNGFLATSITFINEVAGICERVGADVKDVERGLKSDERIGQRAYLTAGGGFAGGTLARDVRALIAVAEQTHAAHNVLTGVMTTNHAQQEWTERVLREELSELSGARIAILGLTYKPGTDTLRRSTAVELAQRLGKAGADVRAYDPAVSELPRDHAGGLHLAPSVDGALRDADAVVIGTPWPVFAQLRPKNFSVMRRRVIVDPTRFLEAQLRGIRNVRYRGVGLPQVAPAGARDGS
jgi:UDPglucose 6-dehydrogenase